MRYSEIISETAAFDAFIDVMFDQYNQLVHDTNRQHVIGRCRHLIRILRNYTPQDDDEEINVESYVEMFEDLIRKSGGTV